MADKWRDALLNVKRIVTHGNCSDGIASAMILRDVLSSIPVEFVEHEKNHLSLEPSEGMLFCDLVPHPDRVHEFIEAKAIVLDHHRSVKHIVRMFGVNGVFADEVDDPGVSGAVLAFREVWLPLEDLATTSRTEVEEFATLAGVFDTWQRGHSRWQDAAIQAEALRFYGEDYWINGARVQAHASRLYPDEKVSGRFVYDQRRTVIQRLAESACVFKVRRLKIAIFNDSESYCSDVAEELRAQGIDVVFGFRYGKLDNSPTLKYSIRTDGRKFNAGAFATANGGGGHHKIAAFGVNEPGTDPFVFVIERLEEYTCT